LPEGHSAKPRIFPVLLLPPNSIIKKNLLYFICISIFELAAVFIQIELVRTKPGGTVPKKANPLSACHY